MESSNIRMWYTFKRIAAIFLVLVITGCYSSKHFNSAKEEQLISSVLYAQQKAWNTGSITAFMEGYWKSPQLSFIGSKGVTRGWEQTAENYHKGYPDKAAMGSLDFEIIELRVLSATAAYMIGKYTLTREDDSPSGHFNLLWEKIDGQWVIVSDHTSG